jgi:hypothetical protein
LHSGLRSAFQTFPPSGFVQIYVCCGAISYVAFSKGSHIRTVGVFERYRTRLQFSKEPEQPGLFPPVFWFLVCYDFAGCKRFGLHLQIDFGVDIGGVEGDVAEPCADRLAGVYWEGE